MVIFYLTLMSSFISLKRPFYQSKYLRKETQIQFLLFPKWNFWVILKNHLEEQYLLEILNALVIVPLTDEIVNLTIEIRKKYKIKLPDAIIYATAKALNAKLITNNITDFNKTDETVELINPFT